MPFRPAERITMANPTHIQIPTAIRAQLFCDLLNSQACGCETRGQGG